VATRRTTGKTRQKANSRGSQAIVIFWLIFIVVIITVFMVNAQTIQKNFNLFKTRLTATERENTPLPSMVEEEPDELVVQVPLPTVPAVREPSDQQPAQGTSAPEPETRTQTPATGPAVQTPPAPTTTQSQVETRDRNIYFTQIDRDGQILHSRVTRRIPVSDSPMLDVLNALFIGPTADELNRGLLNLIPQNTRMITSPIVRDSTAYINFSEDFLFNTFGVEGYVAQLRQVVWTVTEFSNVSDVQILIEGRRLDYLAEGIWIGSPISRQSF